jgi:hypothetical protein
MWVRSGWAADRRRRDVRRAILLALLVLALPALLAVVAAGCGGGSQDAERTTETEAPAPPPVESPPPEETQPPPDDAPGPDETPMPPAPPSRPLSWEDAGAFVWHENDVAPEALGHELLQNGFGWVAVFVHDGLVEDPIEADWVNRFRQATGLPVGGWGVLRTEASLEASLAHEIVERYGLDFYIANAEAEYAYTREDGQNAQRFERSRVFVDAFRAKRPTLPAALSSYCRADMQDLDWNAWRAAGFVFLPQAYVNDFGALVTPDMCLQGARAHFPRRAVHPTIGMHPGAARSLRAVDYVRLLARAGTVGFSVYLAETRMTEGEWQVLGSGIASRGIARAARFEGG